MNRQARQISLNILRERASGWVAPLRFLTQGLQHHPVEIIPQFARELRRPQPSHQHRPVRSDRDGALAGYRALLRTYRLHQCARRAVRRLLRTTAQQQLEQQQPELIDIRTMIDPLAENLLGRRVLRGKQRRNRTRYAQVLPWIR
jgi:hypothetical protein